METPTLNNGNGFADTGLGGKTSIARSLFVIGGFRGVSFLLGLARMVILARLLLPADFGIVAMVATALAILSTGADLGLSLATVQRKDITHPQISTLFWINSLFGIILWGLMAAAGPLAAWFYNEPALITVAAVSGVFFFFGGIGAQPKGLLHRKMSFIRMGLAETVSQAVGLAAGITVACYGGKYWAIVIGQVSSSLVQTVLYIVLSGFRPSLPRRGTGVRQMLHFGKYLVAFNILNFFHRQLDKILIGKWWGKDSLGYYERGYALYNMPGSQVNAPFNKLFLPLLSQQQTSPEKFIATFLDFSKMLILTTSALAGLMFALTPEVVSLLYGEQWGKVVPILRWLALAGICSPMMNVVGNIFVALGRTRRMFFWSVYAIPILSVAFVIGLPYGPVGVARAYAITLLTAVMLPGIWFAMRAVPYSTLSYIKEITPAFLVTAASSGTAWLVNRLAGEGITGLVVACAAALAVHLGLIVLVFPDLIRRIFRRDGLYEE